MTTTLTRKFIHHNVTADHNATMQNQKNSLPKMYKGQFYQIEVNLRLN